jgi:hypothetical protein
MKEGQLALQAGDDFMATHTQINASQMYMHHFTMLNTLFNPQKT